MNNNRLTNGWECIITFCNEHYRDLITRVDLINYMKLTTDLGVNSIDTYRNYLTKAGFLTIVGRGLYNVEKEIPLNYSVKDCLKEAYREKYAIEYPWFKWYYNENKKEEFISEKEMKL
jgi:hypothetical protein